MKYPATQYNELKAALIIMRNRYGLDIETMHKISEHLHYKIYQQKNFNTENLNVILKDNGKRLFEQNEAFKLYPDGCTYAHVQTAMKNAINEIFN